MEEDKLWEQGALSVLLTVSLPALRTEVPGPWPCKEKKKEEGRKGGRKGEGRRGGREKRKEDRGTGEKAKNKAS